MLLLVLTANLLLGAHALAETTGAESDDGSDCGCSESGASISTSGSSEWGAGYGTQNGGAGDSVQQADRAIQNDSNDGVNLIWVNLISIAVVAAIVVMLLRYRKSANPKQKAEKAKNARPELAISPDGSKERKPAASDKTVLKLAERLFMQMQEARLTGDIRLLEPHVGRELYQFLEREQNANGAGNRTKPQPCAEIRNLRIVRRETANGTDRLIVRIQERSIDRSEQGDKEEVGPGTNDAGRMKTSFYTMERAEGETIWKLTQIRRESKEITER